MTLSAYQTRAAARTALAFALEDDAALAFMRDAAAELGIGSRLDLVPHCADPKDLYGLLRDAPAVSARVAGATTSSRLAEPA